jgi:hypothetical protein
LSRGMLASIFRKREDAKAAKLNRPPKHPRRPPVKASTGVASAHSTTTDSNRDAPPWQIEEDWALLHAVKVYLSQSGSINWYLVANVVNISGTFTGERGEGRGGRHWRLAGKFSKVLSVSTQHSHT